MGKTLINIIIAFLFFLFQLPSKPVMACVEGLSWGMNLSNVEAHIGTPLSPVQGDTSSDLFEVKDFQISGLPVDSLHVLITEEYGLKQLAYQMKYENMAEVLAGLRHRFGPPVDTSFDVEGKSKSPYQQWVWHTGEDVITAVKREGKPFLLSYRPSLLDPSFL